MSLFKVKIPVKKGAKPTKPPVKESSSSEESSSDEVSWDLCVSAFSLH